MNQQGDPPYRKKVYDLLSSNFSDFNRTEDEFYSKLDSDPQYASNVYDVISGNFSDFKRTKNEFLDLIKKKVLGGESIFTTPSQLISPLVPKEGKEKSLGEEDAESIISEHNNNIKSLLTGGDVFDFQRRQNDLFNYMQTEKAKAADILSGFKRDGRVAKSDVSFLRSVAPKAATQLVYSGVPDVVKKKIEKTGTIDDNDVDAFDSNHEAITRSSAVLNMADAYRKYNDSQLDVLKSIPGFDISKLSNSNYVDSFIAQQQDRRNNEINELNKAYPIKTETIGMSSFGVPATRDYRDNESEYLKKMSEIDSRYKSIFDGIGRAAASVTASVDADPLQIGLTYLRFSDPNRYKLREKAGSSGADRDIAEVGSQIQLAVSRGADQALKAKQKNDELDERFPDDLIANTKRRLAAELYRSDNWFFNFAPSVDELVRAAENLPEKNKSAFYKYILPQAAASKFTPPILDPAGLNRFVKGADIPKSGAVNSFVSSILSTGNDVGNFISSLAGVRKESDVAKSAINRPYSTEFEMVGQGPEEVARLNQLNEKIKSGQKLTVPELEEKDDLESYTNIRSTPQEIIDGSFSVAGQVLAQALGTKGISAPIGKLLGSKAIGLLATEGAEAGLAEYMIATNPLYFGVKAPQITAAAAAMVAYASSYDQAEQEASTMFPDDPRKRKMYARTVASLNALTERIFRDEKVLDAFNREISPNIRNFVSELSTGKITREALQPRLKSIVMDGLKFIGFAELETGKETVEEIAASLGSDLSKLIISPDKFNASDMYENAAKTATSMFVDGQLVGLFAGAREFRANKVGINLLSKIGVDQAFTGDVKGIIDQQFSSGEITKEQADEKRNILKQIETVNTVDMPFVLGTTKLSENASKKYAISLVNEKLLKQKLSTTTDEAIKSKIKEQIKQSEDLRKSILDKNVYIDSNFNVKTEEDATQESAIKEGLQQGGLVQPEGIIQGQQEAGQGTGTGRQATQPEANVGDRTVSGEGQVKLDPVVISQNSAPLVAEIKSATPEIETGSTMNLDGTQYTGGGLVVPAASMNTTIEEITPEMVSNFINENRGKLSSDIFKAGLYKFPNSNRVSIDLNIVVPRENRDIAIEFGRMAGQESLFDLDTYENIKTGADGLNPISFTDDQFREIADALSKNRMPNVFETQKAISESEGQIESALSRSIDKAAQSLQKTGIKYVVVDPATDTEEAAAARGNQGLFRSSDGTIIIDKSKLENEIDAGLVVWHESAHPVMNIIRNTDKPLYDAVVRGLEGAARQDTEIARAINWAQKNYSKNALSESQGRNVSAREAVEVQNDEAIVDIIARINEGIIDINTIEPGFLQKIIDFINSVAAAIGIDPIIDPTDIEQFKRTVSAVSSALKEGRDIAEVVGEKNVKEYGSPIGEDAQARANEVFDGILEKIGIQIGKPNVKTGKTKVTNFDVAKAMNDYYKKLFKTTKVDDFSNKALETVSDYATDEVIFGINRFGNSSGKGWYTVDYSKALEIMKSFDPDIVDNPDIKEVATAVIAISSNSTDVYTNLTRIIYAIDQFKKTGKVPTDVGVGKGMSAIASSVSVYNNLLDLFGSVSELKDFMQTVRTVSDAKKALIEKSGAKSWAQVKERGLGTDPEWNETEVLPTSVILFGPKIGAFYSNLSGLGGTPTIDRWCIRTMYRYRGDMRAKALPSEINDFIKTNKLDGQSKGSVMSIIQDHSKMFDAILTGRGEFKGQTKEQRNERLKPYRKGSQIWKKMSGVVNEIEDGLTESIKNKAQYAKDFRSFTKKSFERVQQKVKEKIGEDLSISDIQAILWIYEKELFGALGVKQRPESTYSASAQRLLNEMNSGKFTIDQMKSGNVTGETDVTEEGSMGDNYGFDSKTFENGISNQPKRLNDQASVGNREINWERSPAGKGDPSISSRNPIVQEAAKKLKAGKITNEEYRATVSENSPIRPITRFFEPATEKEIRNALSSDKLDKINNPINDNTIVGLRLDIPAYSNKNTWVVSVHDGSTNAGKAISYRNVAKINDVRFGVEPKAALSIAAGVPKTTIGRIFGRWENVSGATMDEQGENAKKLVQNVVNDPNYVQVGMNPFRHSYFYDRSSDIGRPIVSADEVIQIGGLVYAKNPVYGNWTDESYRVKDLFDKAGAPVQFSVGNREEDILRRKPTGPERKRAMAERIEGQPAETVSKINKDALTYFQQTNKQTEDQVREFMKGKDIESLADYVVSDPQIPDVSLVWMAATVAKELKPMIEAARETNPDLARRLSEKQAAIYNQFAVKATELGQAVQAFVAFKGDKDATQFYLNKIISKLVNDYKIDVTDEQIAEIESRLDAVSSAGEGRPKNAAIIELGRYLNSIVPIKAIDVLESIWYAKILSGVTTQATNAFSNLFNTGFELLGLGLRESIKNASFRPFAAISRGAVRGARRGVVRGADILKSGIREQDLNKYFGNNVLEFFSWGRTKIGKAAGGTVGKVLDVFPESSPSLLKYVGRSLAAVDAVFSSINQDAYANMMAWNQAIEEKKTNPTISNYNRVNEILGNTKETINKAEQDAKDEGLYPGTVAYKTRVIELVEQAMPKDIKTESEKFGRKVTLNYEPEGFTKPLYNWIVNSQKDIRALKIFIPFTRIVSNLTEQMINYSPLVYYKVMTGYRDPLAKEGKRGKLTDEERADLAIRGAMGIAAMAILALKAGEDDDDWFEVTANGTDNMQKNYTLEKAGWRPYTITLKDGTKISYANWPIRGVLSAIGNYRDAIKYDQEEDTWGNRLLISTTGALATMYDGSLMKGLSEFVDIFLPERGRYEGIVDGVSKWSAQQAKSVTLSNFTQQMLKLTDEYQGDPIREAKGVAIIYRDLPVVNDGLKPIVDVFGDPVIPKTSEKLSMWYTVDDERKDVVIGELSKDGIFINVPKSRSIVDIDANTKRPMTEDEYYNFKLIYGKIMKYGLYKDMEIIRSLDREDKIKWIDSINDSAADAAKYAVSIKMDVNEAVSTYIANERK